MKEGDPLIRRVKLCRLKETVAIGAAYLVSKKSTGKPLNINFERNVEHFCSLDVTL